MSTSARDHDDDLGARSPLKALQFHALQVLDERPGDAVDVLETALLVKKAGVDQRAAAPLVPPGVRVRPSVWGVLCSGAQRCMGRGRGAEHLRSAAPAAPLPAYEGTWQHGSALTPTVRMPPHSPRQMRQRRWRSQACMGEAW